MGIKSAKKKEALEAVNNQIKVLRHLKTKLCSADDSVFIVAITSIWVIDQFLSEHYEKEVKRRLDQFFATKSEP